MQANLFNKGISGIAANNALACAALASTTLPALAISFPWASNTTHSPAAFRRRNAADRALQYTPGSFSKASSSGSGCTHCPLATHSPPEGRGIPTRPDNRQSGVEGTHVSAQVELGGRRIIKKQKKTK